MKRPLSLVLCFLVPIVILLVGTIFAGIYGYQEIPKLYEETAKGLAAPGFNAVLEKPGKYTVWLHTYTVFEGTAYESGDRLPGGGKVHVFEADSNREFDLISWTSASKSFGSETAVSLGTFESFRPGQAVEVRSSGMSRPVVVSLAPVKLQMTFRVILTISGIMIVSLFCAIVALIVLLHRRKEQIDSEMRN